MSQREKNPIWQYFDKSISDTSKAVCKICNKCYSLGSHEAKKQTSHGLKLHLSKFHDQEYRQVQKRVSELNDFKSEAKLKRTDSSASLKKSSADQSTLVQTTILSLTSKPKVALWPDDHEITKRIDKTITITYLIILSIEKHFAMRTYFEKIRRRHSIEPRLLLDRPHAV